jgi:hypothetical protein
MVTTRAGHAKKISGAELDDDDGDNHGMYLEDLFDDGTNHSTDDEVDHDAHNYQDKSVDLVPRTNVTKYTPPNTDQTLPVPTVVKAIMAEDICRQQNPRAHTFLAELDEEMRKTEYTPPNTVIGHGNGGIDIPIMAHLAKGQTLE